MNIVNVFFPTEYLRDEYIEKVLRCEVGLKGLVEIGTKTNYRQMPGFWITMNINDTSDGRKLLDGISEIIPYYWFEKYIFFPNEVTSHRYMEEKWRQKYGFTGEDINYKGWNTFFKEIQVYFELGRIYVAYIALLFIYKNNPYFLKKYRRFYIFEDLAYGFEALGDLPKSIRCLQIQASLQPKSTEPYLNMSSFLLLNGLYEEAIEVCGIGLEINEDDEYLSNNLLTAYFQGRYYERALEFLEKLIEKNPKKSTYWKLRGDIYCEASDFELAIFSYQKGIDINSEDFEEVEQDIYYGLGICYQAQKEYNKAIENYEKILNINPKDPAALLNLSKLFGDDLKEYNKAQYYAEKMVMLFPQDGYGHHNLGLVYLYTNQLEKAKWHLYKARKIVPDYIPVYEAIEELKKVKRE